MKADLIFLSGGERGKEREGGREEGREGGRGEEGAEKREVLKGAADFFFKWKYN